MAATLPALHRLSVQCASPPCVSWQQVPVAYDELADNMLHSINTIFMNMGTFSGLYKGKTGSKSQNIDQSPWEKSQSQSQRATLALNPCPCAFLSRSS
jgi:hypothetical protein